jgi:hypothetical protein
MADKDFRVKNGIHIGANAFIQGDVTSVDRISMNTSSATEVVSAGQLAWNPDNNTIDIGMNANTTLQVGQEEFYYVKNQTGSDIADGTVVMANGTNGAGGIIRVTPAIANGSFPSKYILGVTTEVIPDGGDGFVTGFGKVRGLDTSAFSEGDILYADPTVAGGLSNTAPIAPNNIVTIAIVINKHPSTGTIFVRPTYASSLYEDETVYVQDLQNNQVLTYISANTRFENKTLDIDNVDGLQTELDGKLNLTGGTLTGDLTIPDKIIHSGDTNTAIRFPAADTVTIETDGSERVRVNSNGNLGIGTTNPVKKLTLSVSPSSTFDDGIRISDGSNFTILSRTGSAYTYRGVSANASLLYSNSAMAFLSDDTTIGITFHNAGNERLRITPTGNVGIGTSSPQATLDIPGHTDSYNTAQFGAFGVQSVNDTNGFLSVNGYWTGTDWIYRSNGTSSLIQFATGDILLRTVPSGISGEIGTITTRLTVKNTGNVGIGTSTPATILDVAGDITIADKIIHSGDTNTAIRFPANDTVTIETAGAERLRVAANGNITMAQATGRVGIGTSDPAELLHLQKDSLLRIRLDRTGAAPSICEVSNEGSLLVLSGNASGVAIFTGATPTEKMRVDTTGNVGIGTNIPDVGLHYTGDTPKLRIESTNSLDDTLGTEEIGRIEWEAARGTNRNVPASIRVQQAGTWSAVTPWFSPTSMGFYTQDSSGVEVTSPRLFIGSTGNVGIGTTTAAYPLQIASTFPQLALGTTGQAGHIRLARASDGGLAGFIGYTSATEANVVSFFSQGGSAVADIGGQNSIIFRTGDAFGAATQRMVVDSTGRVGIGTQIPGTLLHLEAGAALQLRLQRTGAFPSTAYVGNEGNLLVLSSNATGVAINTGASPTEKMRVTTAGFVGIGTTTPATILDVNGDVTITDKIVHSGDTDTAIRFSANDTVSVETAGSERVRIEADGTFVFNNAIKENVFVLTGTTPALDPVNGTIQTWTLTGNSTPTDSLASGEHMTLLIDDGAAHTITWPSVTWKTNAGAAPTLLTTGLTVIVLWKVDTVLYGARVGDA